MVQEARWLVTIQRIAEERMRYMMMTKTGRPRLEAAMKRVFSAVFDYNGIRPETVTLRQDDLEVLLLTFKARVGLSVPEAPNLNPAQQ